MSDFFTRLINRNLGRESVIVPRLRTRFEPEDIATTIPSEDLVSHHDPEDTGQLHANQNKPLFAQARRGDYDLSLPPIITREKAAAEEESPPQKEVQAEMDSNLLIPHKKPFISKISPLAHTKSKDQQVLPSTKVKTHKIDRKDEAYVIPSANKKISEIHQPVSTPIKQDGETNFNQHIDSELRPPELIFPEDAKLKQGWKEIGTEEKEIPPKQGSLEIPQGFPRIKPDINPKQTEKETNQTLEPVINISIGRIELRALQPEKPSLKRSQNKAKGVMSLDDYLGQREKKGRL